MRHFRRKRQGKESRQERPFIQPKLKVGQPGDKYEVEADKMADAVVNQTSKTSDGALQKKDANEEEVQAKPLAASVTPLVQTSMFKEQEGNVQKQEEEELAQTKEEEEPIQKQEEEEVAQTKKDEEPVQKAEEEEMAQTKVEEEPVQKQEEEEVAQTKEEEESIQQKAEEEETVQAKANSPTNPSQRVESQLGNSKGKGSRLPDSTKKEMETGFGADFSDVHIHTGSEAQDMTKQMGAQAFTNGTDIYFNKNKFDANSSEGKHLLAHELTHTIQQEGMVPSQLQFTIGDGNDLTAARFSGNLDLEACLDNEKTLKKGDNGAAVSLMQQALVDAGFPLPRFGVDGKFGSETRNALRDFQRASSLGVDGVLGPSTMSALDSLFSGGAPSLPPAVPVNPPPTTPPTVTTQTIKSAPDGTSDTRKTVGVGERVRLTASTAGTWSVSDGHIIGGNNGANVVWEAPPIASSPTVTITTPGGTKVIPFTVVPPNGLNMVVGNRHAIPAGSAGACMILNVSVQPMNVNLGRTMWFEEPGPATNISGYYSQFGAATLFHNPNPNYLGFNDNNAGLFDHAEQTGANPPFSFGTFEWVIPNKYKIDGEPDARGRVFTNTVQAFTMLPNGTTIITKNGAFVLRTVSNFVF
ncbi:eCIS core domain-containing protein [Aquimarina brevivitae]|uniref:Putative peptidoglycan binding protein n=1 Tax=Aquimarina brevivitae TaxID=323412 RepID=A0A4Q7P1I3_9FLAO|nr:DUF4157 domain-containing protein [Aquimarina brevivitae]RZS92502.1 putative peptidoglycan binding protein [Aquimarina brevivitae]